MKNYVLILFTLVIFCCNTKKSISTNETNILFIGNSLTYFHDMPLTLQKMLNETNSNIKVSQSTFPGMPLADHLTDIITSRTENGIETRIKQVGEKTETEKIIIEKKWDVVILQTGGVSVLIPENRELKVKKAIIEIKKLVSNPNCKFVLINTWPTKGKYPKEYCYSSKSIDDSIKNEKNCSPVLQNLKQEFEILNESYELVAKETDLVKSVNGNKYYEVLTKYPEIEIYEDDMHPNKNGAFLNACIFYQMLTNKKAKKLFYIGDIDPKIAKLLKQIAE